MKQPAHTNNYGVPVRGFESARGGLYYSEKVALEVSAPDGLVHALVRFADVEAVYRDQAHVRKILDSNAAEIDRLRATLVAIDSALQSALDGRQLEFAAMREWIKKALWG